MPPYLTLNMQLLLSAAVSPSRDSTVTILVVHMRLHERVPIPVFNDPERFSLGFHLGVQPSDRSPITPVGELNTEVIGGAEYSDLIPDSDDITTGDRFAFGYGHRSNKVIAQADSSPCDLPRFSTCQSTRLATS